MIIYANLAFICHPCKDMPAIFFSEQSKNQCSLFLTADKKVLFGRKYYEKHLAEIANVTTFEALIN